MMQPLHETDGALLHHWYILALEREVPAGKPVRRWLYDTPYVLFRDGEGKISVFVDRCPHRGAQLSCGAIEEGRIRCPYHGWTFDSSGQLREVPSDGPSQDAPKGKLTGPPTHTKDGAVWVWPGDPALCHEPPPWSFPPARVGYFMITDFDNETTHLVQNFMDVPHTVFVHDKWFRKRASLKVPVTIEAGGGRVKVTYHQENDQIGFTARILNPSGAPMTHTDEFIFPNLTRVDYRFGQRFFVINSQCSPISRYRTRVFTWIAYDLGLTSALWKPFLRFYTRKVITQDVEIMENQGNNLCAFEKIGPAAAFLSTRADEHHLAIDRIRALGAKDPQAALAVSLKKEKEFWI